MSCAKFINVDRGCSSLTIQHLFARVRVKTISVAAYMEYPAITRMLCSSISTPVETGMLDQRRELFAASKALVEAKESL